MENAVEEVSSLKDTAEQALVSLISSVSDAATFLKGEIPFAVQELLAYYTAIYSLAVILGAALSIGVFFAGRAFYRCSWDAEDKLFVGFLSLGGPAAFAAWLLSYTPDLLKVTIAPRIWLIEYAAGLVK